MLNAITNHERAEVLVQALPNIKRYNGKTIVVKYGGNAMIDDSLKAQVMEDVVLLALIGALDGDIEMPVTEIVGVLKDFFLP